MGKASNIVNWFSKGYDELQNFPLLEKFLDGDQNAANQLIPYLKNRGVKQQEIDAMIQQNEMAGGPGSGWGKVSSENADPYEKLKNMDMNPEEGSRVRDFREVTPGYYNPETYFQSGYRAPANMQNLDMLHDQEQFFPHWNKYNDFHIRGDVGPESTRIFEIQSDPVIGQINERKELIHNATRQRILDNTDLNVVENNLAMQYWRDPSKADLLASEAINTGQITPEQYDKVKASVDAAVKEGKKAGADTTKQPYKLNWRKDAANRAIAQGIENEKPYLDFLVEPGMASSTRLYRQKSDSGFYTEMADTMRNQAAKAGLEVEDYVHHLIDPNTQPIDLFRMTPTEFVDKYGFAMANPDNFSMEAMDGIEEVLRSHLRRIFKNEYDADELDMIIDEELDQLWGDIYPLSNFTPQERVQLHNVLSDEVVRATKANDGANPFSDKYLRVVLPTAGAGATVSLPTFANEKETGFEAQQRKFPMLGYIADTLQSIRNVNEAGGVGLLNFFLPEEGIEMLDDKSYGMEGSVQDRGRGKADKRWLDFF